MTLCTPLGRRLLHSAAYTIAQMTSCYLIAQMTSCYLIAQMTSHYMIAQMTSHYMIAQVTPGYSHLHIGSPSLESHLHYPCRHRAAQLVT